MAVLLADNRKLQVFATETEGMIGRLSRYEMKSDLDSLKRLVANFKMKTEDFYRENRKLNIGIIGQVKAGKSSFLNTLLFEGKDVLPKAATPKTATLTKMEYSEENIIHVEYYSEDDWDALEDNAASSMDGAIFSSARELVNMARDNGLNPRDYLRKGHEDIHFDSYDELIAHLNDYVGENGKYTPIVKVVTLYLNNEAFKGLSIVDTPGLNDPIISRTLRTQEFMEICDVVFFLSQSEAFLDKSDWNLLSSQLPQKGVKKMVLIASKFDSALRSVLRKKNPDDPFDDSPDNIQDAIKEVKKKLKKRAKEGVDTFKKEMTFLECSQELISVIEQCATPVFVSSIAYNMSQKPIEAYNADEKNVYNALMSFSDDSMRDLGIVGNFDDVKRIFADVVIEKERILANKSESFIPFAKQERTDILRSFLSKAEHRCNVLNKNDREQLDSQKIAMEKQINSVKGSISMLFGDLNTNIENEKVRVSKEIRETQKQYADLQQRTGTKTETGSYTTRRFIFFKKKHFYTYETSYSYVVAADAASNLNKYAADAGNAIQDVFSNAVGLKELRRKLLDTITKNFDMGSEKYDSNLFRSMVEDAVGKISFPIFRCDISDDMNGITTRFTGKLVSEHEKGSLKNALLTALGKICDKLFDKMNISVSEFKKELADISNGITDNLLQNVRKEFEVLSRQCEQKEQEIQKYRDYIAQLNRELER